MPLGDSTRRCASLIRYATAISKVILLANAATAAPAIKKHASRSRWVGTDANACFRGGTIARRTASPSAAIPSVGARRSCSHPQAQAWSWRRYARPEKRALVLVALLAAWAACAAAGWGRTLARGPRSELLSHFAARRINICTLDVSMRDFSWHKALSAKNEFFCRRWPNQPVAYFVGSEHGIQATASGPSGRATKCHSLLSSHDGSCAGGNGQDTAANGQSRYRWPHVPRAAAKGDGPVGRKYLAMPRGWAVAAGHPYR